jgi:hypothetical protein
MKRTEYLLDFYHFGDDSVKKAHAEIVQALRELLPCADVTTESVKSDFWQLRIEVRHE